MKQWKAAMKIPTGQPYSYAEPQTTPNLHLSKPVQTVAGDKPRRRRLTPAELSDERVKGLCYIYDEKYESLLTT